MSTIQNRHGALYRVERITTQQSAEGAVRCLELVDEHGATCYVPTSSLQTFFDLDLDGALELVESLRDDVDEARRERNEVSALLVEACRRSDEMRADLEQARRACDLAEGRLRDAQVDHSCKLDELALELRATQRERDAARDELDVVKAERDKLREALADARRMEGEK